MCHSKQQPNLKAAKKGLQKYKIAKIWYLIGGIILYIMINLLVTYQKLAKIIPVTLTCYYYCIEFLWTPEAF